MKTEHNLNILGRELTIRTEDSPDHVKAIEALLTERIDAIGGGGEGKPMYNTLLLAALNLAGEVLRERKRRDELKEKIRSRTEALLNRIELPSAA
jgi:cell division protein ZapA (FtsZ GTPase activity inhibitor)